MRPPFPISAPLPPKAIECVCFVKTPTEEFNGLLHFTADSDGLTINLRRPDGTMLVRRMSREEEGDMFQSIRRARINEMIVTIGARIAKVTCCLLVVFFLVQAAVQWLR